MDKKHDNDTPNSSTEGMAIELGNYCLIIPIDSVGQEFRQGKLGCLHPLHEVWSLYVEGLKDQACQI